MYIFNEKFYGTKKCVPTKCARCFKFCGQFSNSAGPQSIVINLATFRCKQDGFMACRGWSGKHCLSQGDCFVLEHWQQGIYTRDALWALRFRGQALSIKLKSTGS